MRVTKHQKALRLLTKSLCANLRKTAKSYQGKAPLLFEEINGRYPKFLLNEQEAELLFDEVGAKMLAARYLEDLTPQEILELSTYQNGETE